MHMDFLKEKEKKALKMFLDCLVLSQLQVDNFKQNLHAKEVILADEKLEISVVSFTFLL